MRACGLACAARSKVKSHQDSLRLRSVSVPPLSTRRRRHSASPAGLTWRRPGQAAGRLGENYLRLGLACGGLFWLRLGTSCVAGRLNPSAGHACRQLHPW